MARQKNKAIRQRAWSRADAGLPDLSQEELEGVAKWRDYLFEDLGILIGEGDAIPSTNGVPRIFVLQADDDGREHPLSLDAAGLAPGLPRREDGPGPAPAGAERTGPGRPRLQRSRQ